MALVEEAIVDVLEASTGLTSLLGATTAIYHMKIPSSAATPYIAYALISRQRYPLMGSGNADVIRSRIQIDIYDDDAGGTSTIKSVADKVRLALDRYASSTGVVTIQDCYLEDETDLYEDEAKLYRIQQDYFVWSVE